MKLEIEKFLEEIDEWKFKVHEELKGLLYIELPGLLQHHERFDGAGYPDGLRGEEIPLGARIIAVADTYDAITATRSYRLGSGWDQALDELRSAAADGPTR